MKIESHVTVESSGQSAVALFETATGLPKQRIKNAMTKGAVWLTRGRNTQRLRRAKRILREGDELQALAGRARLDRPPSPRPRAEH